MSTNRDGINDANPNVLSDRFRQYGLGDALRSLPVYLRGKTPVALTGEQPGTLQGLALPNSAKALAILSAYARAGGVTGALTVVAGTPASGQVGIAPSGDIVFLAADALTDVDVCYTPDSGSVLENFESQVVANVFTIPATYTGRKVVGLLKVEVITGTATGLKQVLAPGAGAPAAGQARLDLAKTTVTFAVADAVTKCKATLLLGALVDRSAFLEAENNTLLSAIPNPSLIMLPGATNSDTDTVTPPPQNQEPPKEPDKGGGVTPKVETPSDKPAEKSKASKAANMLTLTTGQLKERMQRKTEGELVKLFGTSDPVAIQKMRQEYESLTKQREEQRLATLSETQKLTEQLEREKQARLEVENRFNGMQRQITINEESKRVGSIFSGYIDDKYMKHAMRDFAEEMLVDKKLTDKQINKLGEKDIRKWCEGYAKKFPAFSKPKQPATTSTEVAKNGSKTGSKPNGKQEPTNKPKSPKDMSEAEWRDYRLKNGIRY